MNKRVNFSSTVAGPTLETLTLTLIDNIYRYFFQSFQTSAEQ